MKSTVGTMTIGVRAPIIRKGDLLPQIVAKSVIDASNELKLPIEKGDIICITESVVARSEGNYVSVDDVAADIREKYGDAKIALIHPILSRNHFAMCLKGICRGARNGGVVLVLSLPSDEVGNHLISLDEYTEAGFDYKKCITEKEFRKFFPKLSHEFTGVDYISYYKSIAEAEGCRMEVIFSNDPASAMYYTKSFLACDIHSRERTKRLLRKLGAYCVYGLDDICSTPNVTTGYNKLYGLLGSNMANSEQLKLMPKQAEYVVNTLQYLIYDKTKVSVDVLVYGNGAFKDPVGQIWELADPVIGVAYTNGLRGRPNELKLKALADGKFADLKGEELNKAIQEEIKAKERNLKGKMASEGTTPRRLTDLLGSLADLTSGSGDKGTPIVWIKGYFKNYAD